MKRIRIIGLFVMLLISNLTLASVVENDVVTDGNEPVNCNCQDTIYLNDGRVFPIDLVDETSMKVKYKKCDDPLNRTWGKDKNAVNRVITSEGEVMIFNDSYIDEAVMTKDEKIGLGLISGILVAGIGAVCTSVVVVLVGIGIW